MRWWGREGPQFPGRGLCALSRRRAGSGGGQTASLPAQLRDPTCAPGPPGRRDSGRLRTWGASPRRRGRTAEPQRAGGPAGRISRSAAGSKKQNSELDSHAPPRPLTRPGQARGAQRAPSGAVPSPPSNTTSRNTCPSYPVWLGPGPGLPPARLRTPGEDSGPRQARRAQRFCGRTRWGVGGSGPPPGKGTTGCGVRRPRPGGALKQPSPALRLRTQPGAGVASPHPTSGRSLRLGISLPSRGFHPPAHLPSSPLLR